jgi:hypothetical protein
MKKDTPQKSGKAKEPTPFQKFDALAKRVIRTPKDKTKRSFR